ncbi:MAG: TraR/DksA C4-type zinc finger protein [Pseudomonadales bacterium]|nr:TraR/DksA C4-type zinc finger protein [Pseudomonadales bacterium]MCP5216475.1 TraR/DksA C4-type zinc finger protein [Pseudomonadales bacterium]
MNSRESNALKRQICARITNLEVQLADLKHSQQKLVSQSDDESATMDIKITSAVNSQVTDSEHLELAQLKENLQWLDTEEAGFCSECGCVIPIARLQAVPVTRLCIGCAE